MSESMLSDDDREDYRLLGRARVLIEWLVDHNDETDRQYARQWIADYEKRAKGTFNDSDENRDNSGSGS